MSDLLENPPVLTISIPLPGKTKTVRAVLYAVIAASSFSLLIISATVSPPSLMLSPLRIADENYFLSLPGFRPIVSSVALPLASPRRRSQADLSSPVSPLQFITTMEI